MYDPILIEGQGTGFLPDPLDNRDKEYDHLTYGSAPFDWEKGYDVEEELGFSLIPKDQGKRSSCVGEGTAMYAFVLNCLEAIGTRYHRDAIRSLQMSAKSIYSLIHLPQGGAYIRDAMKLMVKRGVNFEISVPSIGGEQEIRDRSWLSGQTDAEASIFKAKEYRTITQKTNIDLIAKAMEEGHGVVIGFDVENNGTWRTVRPRVATYRQSGHCMYLGKAKLNKDGKKEVWALNSWGDDVGDNGWQAFGEEWFKAGRVSNAWVLIDKTNSLRMMLLDRNGKPRKFNKYLIRLLTRLP